MQLEKAIEANTHFEEVKLFNRNYNTELRTKTDKVLKKAVFLNIDQKELQKVFSAGHPAIRFVVPYEQGKEIEIYALRHDIYTKDFKVKTQAGHYDNYVKGIFYKGIVKGADQSSGSVSIFEDEVIAIFSTNETGNLVLGQMQDNGLKTSAYVIFDDKDFLVTSGFECEMEDPDPGTLFPVLNRSGAPANAGSGSGNCVRWYFECEYDMFLENGSVESTVNKMSAIYNQVKILYDNEYIPNKIDQIFVWSEPDGYSTSSTSEALSQFVERRTPLPGNANVAHLISRGAPTGGGLANGIGGFCQERPLLEGVNGTTPHSYSWIQSNFNPFPTYSWTVNVIAHENGHNLGAFHTHGCYWGPNYPNGGLQIDDCGNSAGRLEGADCYDRNNPVLPDDGGTVMSYCHLLNNVGINLLNGFGGQPGDVIRDYVYNSSCSGTCTELLCPEVIAEVSPEVFGEDGAIDLTVFGGDPPYGFIWSNGATTKDINGLTAGTYSVTITAGNDCAEVHSITVNHQSGCQSVINEFPFEEDFEAGTLGVFGQGTEDDYNWEINIGETPTNRTGPIAAYKGLYYAYAEATGHTGGKKAILTGCFDFTGLTGPEVTFAYNMYGSNIGSLSIEVEDISTGQRSVVWRLSGSQGAFWKLGKANLSEFAGKNVEIRFISQTGGGSSDRADIAIDGIVVEVGAACEPPLLDFSATPAACFGESSGTATVFVSEGTPPYSYLWSNGKTTATISGVPAGNYEITVTDAAECTVTGITRIEEPAELDLDFMVLNESAPNTGDGAIILSCSGGTPGYEFIWSNGANTKDLSGLSEGEYSVTVTDRNGCEVTGSAAVAIGAAGSCNDEGMMLPLNEGFEVNFGDWENNGDFNWIRNAGGTPSRRTGPNSAYEDNYYAFAEADGNQKEQAILLSPCLDLTGADAQLDFAYHMYGATQGSLAVEVGENGGPNWETLWIRNGDQGNSWRTAVIDLSAYTNRVIRIRLVATIGDGSAARSDIAIDQLSITNGTGAVPRAGTVIPTGNHPVNGRAVEEYVGRNYSGYKKDPSENLLEIAAMAPVPAHYEVRVTLISSTEQELTLSLLDYTGKFIKHFDYHLFKGMNRFDVDLTDLQSGLYFMNIECNGGRLIKKFEVVK